MEKINYNEIHYKVRIYKVNSNIPYFNKKKIKIQRNKNNSIGTVKIYKNEKISSGVMRWLKVDRGGDLESGVFSDTGFDFIGKKSLIPGEILIDGLNFSLPEVIFENDKIARVFWFNRRLYCNIIAELTDEELQTYNSLLTAEERKQQIQLFEELHDGIYIWERHLCPNRGIDIEQFIKHEKMLTKVKNKLPRNN